MERPICRRGVIYVTDICNLQCPWCYYRFLENRVHKPLDQIKEEVVRQKFYYNLQYTDLTGKGEPTLHPKIDEIVNFCAVTGLKPTIITNGQRPEIFHRLIQAGLDDVLLSVQGVGEVHDKAVAKQGAFEKVLETIETLEESDFTFRTNTTITKINMRNLPALASFFRKVKPRMVNMIVFNPHQGTDWAERTNIEFQARYSDIAPHLKKAIDILMADGIWVNVRYMPLCIMRGYEQHVCNHSQFQYDPYEWELRHEFLLTKEEMNRLVEIAELEGVYGESCEEKLLNLLARRLMRGNMKAETCKKCVNYLICDGVYSQYFRRFGFGEFSPVEEGYYIKDPLHYRLQNLGWAT